LEAFKKEFYIKIGKEFNPYSTNNRRNWGDMFIESIQGNQELAGYFCEGLSEILKNDFEKKQGGAKSNSDDLSNRFELFKLFSIASYDSSQGEFPIIKTALQNREGFTEDSNIKIGENLEQFTQKFAQDFAS
jgi:hypothetical protein